MGFQHMKEPIRVAAQRKGGKIRVKKGFGSNPELAREAGAKGGITKHANKAKGIVKTQEDTSDSTSILERLLEDLDEQIQEQV